MVINGAVLSSLVLQFMLGNVFLQAYGKSEEKIEVCSFTLNGIWENDSCPTFHQMLKKLESDSKRISELEEELGLVKNKCCLSEREPEDIKELEVPKSDFDRIFTNNVIAHYNFSENVLDSSGNDHHGKEAAGVLYVEGISGLAASFQGKQKINVDSFRNFDWGSRLSVSVWFKRTGEWSNYQGIVSNGFYTTGSWELRMGREMSGQMLGGGVNTADSPETWNYVDIQATPNQWHHVVMTYDGNILNYYLDKVRQEGDQNCCHGDILIKDTPLTIGQAGVGSSKDWFYGLVDELTIFNKVLSADDISTIYNAQNPEECADPSLIAYFPFDENYNDQSCSNRPGVPAGGVTITSSTSISGSSAYFSGDAKVTVDLFRGYDWGNQFTVSVWFKRTGGWGNYQGIVSNGYHSGGSWEIRMGRENSGQMLGGGVVTSDSSKTWDYSQLIASQNQWHHVAMVYDGTQLNFYLDNVRQTGNELCCSGDLIPRDKPVIIGASESGEQFYGYIDELKIFSRALSYSEVSEIYESLHQKPDECGDTSLIAYFPFDEHYNDESCSHRPGVSAGGVTITSSTSILGSSAYFSGNAKVTVDLFRGYGWGNQFTVSVWFKRTGEWGNYQGIVSNGYYSGGSWEIRMGRENSGQMLGGGVVTSDSSTTWDYSQLIASQNQWHHVAMVYDGTQLNFYLDNVRQTGNELCCSGDLIPRDKPLIIGASETGEYFYGYIDELKIFSRALNSSEISEIYESLQL